MPEERDPALAAWMAAESAAYTAIHALYQRTQGGRFSAPDARIEQIARLRKEADVRFASLWGALGTAAQPRVAVAVAGAVAVSPEPVRAVAMGQLIELRSRAAAEPVEKRRSLG
ncbi:hypothetical protein QTI51_20355 [Variovorax sp. J22G73]|uniref:hypothetical protein n=1 Tax=unclassified Variovorax TaxID=663243 RepID=UPI002576ACE8|nr:MULTISPECIES: hypothetical protein [unclassified Variovorax]MDM0005621.1 hypothetical protein [Variovorax sp. J22R203]MDM0099648.1 hypothetical protein [Variovorax sp. J22G73]